MSKRRSEQIQPGKGKPGETHITTPDGTNAVLPDEPASGTIPAEPNALGKYWIAIIVWAVGFALMIVFELMSALFRR